MRFVGNISDHTWSLASDLLEPSSANVEIGFISNDGPLVEFDGLSFGIDAVCADKTFSVVEPPEGVVYVSTDQETLAAYALADTVSDEEWTFTVWAENAGTPFTDSFVVTVARPASPFPSWIWDNGAWVAPVPAPQDGKQYRWDEDAQQWFEYVPPTE